MWKGALLIAISNPSSERIKLVIQDDNATSIPLATVTLQYLNTPLKAPKIYNTHLPARIDILEKYLYNVQESKSRGKILKQTFYRLIHIKDYNLTVSLLDRLKNLKDISPEKWYEELLKLEGEVCAQKVYEKKWVNFFVGLIPIIQKLLLIVAACTLAYALYPIFSGESGNTSDFVVLILIAVLECILGMITKVIE